MADAAFSEDGKYFSSISKDGRIRIWDTETNILKQEYTPDLHLTLPPSCLQWITASESSTVSGKNPEANQCIALGTRSGNILIYSVTQAKVESVLIAHENSKSKSHCIVSLDWHRSYGLYSCTSDGVLHHWDLERGAQRNKYNVNVDSNNKINNLSAIKIIPHNQNTPACFVATSSTQVRVWRLLEGECELVQELGHRAVSGPAIMALAASDRRCLLLQGSQTERLLSVWDVTVTSDHVPAVNGTHGLTPSNRNKRRKAPAASAPVTAPACVLLMEDAARCLHMALEESGAECLVLVAASTRRSAALHYYRHLLDRSGWGCKPLKPTVTILVCSEDAEPLVPAACRLLHSDVIIGYTRHHGQITFETVTPDLKTKTQTLIRGTERKESKRKGRQQAEGAPTRHQTTDPAVSYLGPLGDVDRKRPAHPAKAEAPMEQLLANLTMQSSASKGSPVAAHRLTRLLMQGLVARDNKLSMSVLVKNNASAALQTVSALPAEYLPPLLDQLALIAQRNTTQCSVVCTWMSAVLRCHSALLLTFTSSATSNHLTLLLAIFAQRRAHLCQLLNLRGRVELTQHQRSQHHHHQPVLHYNDTTSESEAEGAEGTDDEADGHSWSERDSDGSERDSDGSERDSDGSERDSDGSDARAGSSGGDQ